MFYWKTLLTVLKLWSPKNRKTQKNKIKINSLHFNQPVNVKPSFVMQVTVQNKINAKK